MNVENTYTYNFNKNQSFIKTIVRNLFICINAIKTS